MGAKRIDSRQCVYVKYAPAGEQVELARQGGGRAQRAALRCREGQVAVFQLLERPLDLGGGLRRLGHVGFEPLWWGLGCGGC